MGIKNSIRVKKKKKMKLSFALLAVAAADDKKVPPRHPLQRLNRLTEFSHEILDDWFSFVPSKAAWKRKFTRNAERMKTNFERGNQRCGFYDEDQLPHGPEERKRRSDDEFDRYNREDPSEGIKQITTGYRKWAERYLSQCSGQKQYQHQINRMNKWNSILQRKLAGDSGPKKAISCEWSNQEKAVGSQIAYPTCSDGKVIQIKDAAYGRWDQTTCVRPDGKHMGQCNGEADHTEAVKEACEGQESCIYHGNNQVAGDPCWGIVKYTVINYSCV